MNKLAMALSEAVQNQDDVSISVGGQAFDVKMLAASVDKEPPPKGAPEDTPWRTTINLEIWKAKEQNNG